MSTVGADKARRDRMISRAAYRLAQILEELAVDCDCEQGQQSIHDDEKRELQRVKNWALETASQFDRIGNQLTGSGYGVDSLPWQPVD